MAGGMLRADTARADRKQPQDLVCLRIVLYCVILLISLHYFFKLGLCFCKLCQSALMQKALSSVIQTIAQRAVYSFELVLKYVWFFLFSPSAQS